MTPRAAAVLRTGLLAGRVVDPVGRRAEVVDLESYGWSSEWAAAFEQAGGGSWLRPARVIEEHRGRLVCIGAGGSFPAEPSGRLRYCAAGPEELPGVGDWIGAQPEPDGVAIVQLVLPRRTALLRKMPGDPPRAQLVAANVDLVLVATPIDAARGAWVERALAVVRESGARPLVVLTKCDLVDDPEPALASIRERSGDAEVLAVSAVAGEGIDALGARLLPGVSAVLLGASGVGKSTLVNRILGDERMATAEVRSSDAKGRHTTTHRQLLPTPTGAVLIDTPGMRELGLWDDAAGVDAAFPEIEARLGRCRFHDCGHGSEPGCAVQEAIANGEVEASRWAHYLKLKREAARLEERRSAAGRAEQRQRARSFSKRTRNRWDKRRPKL